jgi:terminase small subunit-like protein
VGKEEKKKMGRPTKLTPEVKAEICERIADGESLRKILESDPKRFPTKKYVLIALEADKDFGTQYARAREAQADHWAEEIISIADDGTNDVYTRTDKDGNEYEAVNYDHIQRSKLRVDARKWIASKLKPKKYGEKLQLAGDEENPVRTKVIIDGGPNPYNNKPS